MSRNVSRWIWNVPELITIVFLTLQISRVIHWSALWLFSPLWILLGMLIVICIRLILMLKLETRRKNRTKGNR